MDELLEIVQGLVKNDGLKEKCLADVIETLGNVIEFQGANARLAANCALALSDNGMLNEATADGCRTNLQAMATLLDRISPNDTLPPDLAVQLAAAAKAMKAATAS